MTHRDGGLLLALLAAVAPGPGCGGRCREGTVLVTLTYDGPSSTADALAFLVIVGDATMPASKMRSPGGTADTVEIDFGQGYPGGATITVEVTATSAGTLVGHGITQDTLGAGCGAIAVAVAGSSGGDGSPQDLATADAPRKPVTPYTSDPNTLLLDHFNGTTEATLTGFRNDSEVCGNPQPAAPPRSAYVGGPPGLDQALQLDPALNAPAGSATYLEYPGGQLLSEPDGSIELWVYLTAYAASGDSWVAQGTYFHSCAGWTFGMGANDLGQVYAGAWNAFSMTSGSSVVPLRTWTHVAATWGKSGAKLYMNGALVGSSDNTGRPAPGFGGSVLVPLASGQATARIDELRISDVQRLSFNH